MKIINLWEQTQWVPFEYENISDISLELEKRKIEIKENVVLQSNVFLSYNSFISKDVVIGSGVTIGNNVFIGESVTIDNYTTIEDNTIIRGNTRIGQRSIIGANVNIGCNVIIESGVTINGGLVLSKDANIISNSIIKNSLRITGSRDEVSWYGTNDLHIGCVSLPIDQWLETFQSVGEEYKYSQEEIDEYLSYMKICKQLRNQTIKN